MSSHNLMRPHVDRTGRCSGFRRSGYLVPIHALLRCQRIACDPLCPGNGAVFPLTIFIFYSKDSDSGPVRTSMYRLIQLITSEAWSIPCWLAPQKGISVSGGLGGLKV